MGTSLDPISLAVTADDRIVVCDHNNHQLKMFSLDGQLLQTFAPGNMPKPGGVGVTSQGEVVVTDENSRIHVRCRICDDRVCRFVFVAICITS